MNTTYRNTSIFNSMKKLNWKNGIGTLPVSALKFCTNEFDLMEVIDEDKNKAHKDSGIGGKENICLSRNSSKACSISTSSSDKKNKEQKIQVESADIYYCCQGCGCYGLASEFIGAISCSLSCMKIIKAKKQLLIRKQNLKKLHAKRACKKLLQDRQQVQKKENCEIPKDKIKEKINYKIYEDKISGEMSSNSKLQYPWQTGKSGFSWAKYLEHLKATAAPVKLFKDSFPYGKNQFRVGMKLEGIDPEYSSRYCVLTVVEVIGYRIRLHFDGYPKNYDFWTNADSMDIFPVGWTEKNGHKLNPPKGYVASNFNWNAYLKMCKAIAAPKSIFANKNSVFPTCFRVGMKLEALDRKRLSRICVASVAGLLDSRILVHFDSWDEIYDYWADTSSPYIHPVGWCHHNGYSLTPPNNFMDPKEFTWDAYLRETHSVAAPARAFKQKPLCGFKCGMKLEAVDKRVPQLIRVATVEDVKNHMLKIRFDGWPKSHDYWVDDDSTDIHPIGWCAKTGHPLEPPLTPDNYNEHPECGTYGCRGIGNIKGYIFATHNTSSHCPYSAQNLNIRVFPDRFKEKIEIYENNKDYKKKRTNILKIIEKPEKLARYAYDKNKKLNTPANRSNKTHLLYSDNDAEHVKKRKICSDPCEPKTFAQLFALSNSTFVDSITTSTSYASSISDKQYRTELCHSIYNPRYNSLSDAPNVWAKYSSALNRAVAKQNTNPRRWSNEEVIKFIQLVPNCQKIGNIFRKHYIDGESFLMLTQEDLVTLLGLKLGHAIKLYNSIVLLRRKAI